MRSLVKLQYFNFDGRMFRAIAYEGVSWFSVKDVCLVLGLTMDRPETSTRLRMTCLAAGDAVQEIEFISLDCVCQCVRCWRRMSDGNLGDRFWEWLGGECAQMVLADGNDLRADRALGRRPEALVAEASDQGDALCRFEFSSHQLRAVERDGEIWFVAKDVCDALDLGNPTEALRPLEDDEKAALSISEGSSQRRQMNLINESGLYNLAFRSRKEEARAFRRWVTHEVLPEIRKRGSYGAQPDVSELVRRDFEKLQTLMGSIQDRVEELTSLSFSSAAKKLGTDWRGIEKLIAEGELQMFYFERRRRIPIDSIQRYLSRQPDPFALPQTQ